MRPHWTRSSGKPANGRLCAVQECNQVAAGTMMMTVGADLYTTCKLMGHADVRTTQIYAKIVDSKKIEAVGMVDKLFEQRGE